MHLYLIFFQASKEIAQVRTHTRTRSDGMIDASKNVENLALPKNVENLIQTNKDSIDGTSVSKSSNEDIPPPEPKVEAPIDIWLKEVSKRLEVWEKKAQPVLKYYR